MFERFTHQAKEVVVRAQREARELGHNYIGAEHLMLGALAQPEAPGVAALTRLGITPETFRTQTQETVGSSGLGVTDADALQSLGIDLDEVRRRVEDAFGPGALDKPLRTRRSWLPWRRRRCVQPVGHIPFTPRAKQVLEVALREAIHRKNRHIGVEHVLLAMTRVKGSVALEVVRRLGADAEEVRRAVLSELDQAA